MSGAIDLTCPGWLSIREARIQRYGIFGWFLKGPDWIPHGWDEHNYRIFCELAAQYGWMTDEPAGDVPMEQRKQ
jgi:hypothetical protein